MKYEAWLRLKTRAGSLGRVLERKHKESIDRYVSKELSLRRRPRSGVEVELDTSMQPPTRDEVIGYAAGLGIAGTPAATYWAHGDQTKWTMRDGQKVHDWRACFRLWIEKMQGRPGFEIVLHDRPKSAGSKSAGDTIAELESQQRQKAHKTFDIVRLGRESKASDLKIIAVLRSRGLVWPDYADVRYARPESEADGLRTGDANH